MEVSVSIGGIEISAGVLQAEAVAVAIGDLNFSVNIPTAPVAVTVGLEVVEVSATITGETGVAVAVESVGGGEGGGGTPISLIQRVEELSPSLYYTAKAATGSLETDPVWAVSKLEIIGDDVTTLLAGGVESYTNRWSDRATLIYS